MEHLLEKLLGVLFDGDVHLHFQGMGASVGVLRLRVVIGCALGKAPHLALTIDLFENRRKPHSLALEPPLEALQC